MQKDRTGRATRRAAERERWTYKKMNLAQIKNNVGWLVQLEPVACRLDEAGRELDVENDDWVIQEVTNDVVRISNLRTNHIVKLGKDHIHHFTTNPDRATAESKYGFLTLHVQIYLQGSKVRVRPNSRPGERLPPDDRPPAERNDRARLLDQRFQMIIQDYRIRGTPQHMIETFPDLTRAEKAELYERSVMWKKGRPSKRNPYK